MKDKGKKNERGMALVLTLMILVILTALVTEFSYGVFTTTSALHNWETSQRLSFVARSGVTLAVKTISDVQRLYNYTYPGRVGIPVENILKGFSGSVVITVEDEDARFNLNSLRNLESLKCFKILLETLELKEDIADRIADWIDIDSNPRLSDSEEGVRNSYLDSVDEVFLIKGIDYQAYEKLLPYVTVNDYTGNVVVNINTASIPVIMSLDKDKTITKELAEKVVRAREIKPFSGTDDPKFGDAVTPHKELFMAKVATKSSNFRIKVVAEENKIKRVIETVVQIGSGGMATIKYWKES